LKGVFNGVEYIFDTLKQDVHQCEIDLASNRIDRNGLDELDPSFMYSKLLLEIISKIQYDEEGKKAFFSYCREQYTDNSLYLKAIDQFEQCYEDHSPIWWYTKETFLFPILNKALRTLDVDIIIKMGFFFQDFRRQIEQLHSNAQYTMRMMAYRGQGLSKIDFEKLKKSIGGLLSFNIFLSTSIDREVSVCFADAARSNPNMVGVIFQIEIDPSVSSTPYAKINDISYFADSTSEIIFSTNSIFRMDTIEQIADELWQVNLILVSDTNPELKCLMDYIRDEIYDQNPLYSLALLMNKMGHFDKAREIYATLLEPTSSVTSYGNIGLMYQSMGDYSAALSYYEQTLESDQKSLPSDHLSLATIFNNIATVHQRIGNYSLSLSYYEKALDIKQKALPPEHLSLATHYNNIGEVYSSMGEYSKALSFYEQTLEIQQKSLPRNHPSFAITYNNIGLVHRSIGNYSIALLSYKKTLDIELHFLQPGHPSFAITYNNMGLLYSFLKDYPTALSYYEKALDIAQKISPSNHLSLALIYNNIGEVHDSMKDYSLALSYYEKALEIQQKYLPSNHPELAAVYNNIGEVYRSQENYSTALTYYERTLEIEQKIFPSNHPSLAITYINMAVTFEAQQRYEDAVKYTEQAFDILHHVFGLNHSKTKETKVYLDELQEKL
jgi:tetratricopeptide (TPR) repeat protein